MYAKLFDFIMENPTNIWVKINFLQGLNMNEVIRYKLIMLLPTPRKSKYVTKEGEKH